MHINNNYYPSAQFEFSYLGTWKLLRVEASKLPGSHRRCPPAGDSGSAVVALPCADFETNAFCKKKYKKKLVIFYFLNLIMSYCSNRENFTFTFFFVFNGMPRSLVTVELPFLFLQKYNPFEISKIIFSWLPKNSCHWFINRWICIYNFHVLEIEKRKKDFVRACACFLINRFTISVCPITKWRAIK